MQTPKYQAETRLHKRCDQTNIALVPDIPHPVRLPAATFFPTWGSPVERRAEESGENPGENHGGTEK